MTIDLRLPTRWGEMRPEQLSYYLGLLLANDSSADEIRVRCMLRWLGLRPVRRKGQDVLLLRRVGIRYEFVRSTVGYLTEVSESLRFLEEKPQEIVRLERKGQVDAMFQGVSFRTYLTCDSLFQAYLLTQDIDVLRDMAKLMEPGRRRWSDVELLAVFYWFYSLKCVFANRFNYLYSGGGVGGGGEDMQRVVEQSIFNQVRALTGGDVTKSEMVYEYDTYQALWELNEKAREALEAKLERK